VRWRRVRMLFHLGKRAYDLGSARGFLAFPMSLRDKAGFVRLMLKAFAGLIAVFGLQMLSGHQIRSLE